MLELITAKQPIEKGKYVVREVRTMMDKKDDEHYGLRELMDRSIRSSGHVLGFGKYLELALQCVEDSATDRPTMSEVQKVLLDIPYADTLPKKDASVGDSDVFDYSGGYTISAEVEPK
ncbi:hypothetical protein V6N13_093092 [Hibiscus sabdariffa]